MENLEHSLAITFPKTPEEFDRVRVLSTGFLRISLVDWMHDIDKIGINIIESDDDRKMFSVLAETMESSFSNTNELYKIQAAKNLDEEVDIHVLPENIYYNVLFKAHKLWTTITTKFQKIFLKYNVYNKPGYVFQIPTKPLTERAILIIRAIVSSKTLRETMTELQENSEIMLSYIQLNLSQENYLANTFPKTPEEFDRVRVLSRLFVRNDLVKWMNEMDKRKIDINESDVDRETFSSFVETMWSSFLNTNELYKIQVAKNLDEKVDIHVLPENIYHNVLFNAHKIWTTITTEFQNIFLACNMYHKPGVVLQIPTEPLSERAISIVQAIVENEKLVDIMILLQENSEIMLGYIQLCRNSIET